MRVVPSNAVRAAVVNGLSMSTEHRVANHAKQRAIVAVGGFHTDDHPSHPIRKGDSVTQLKELLCRLPKNTHWQRKKGKHPFHVERPLIRKDVEQHLKKKIAVGLAPIAPGESTTKVALFDLDNHKAAKIDVRGTAKRIINAAFMEGYRATAFTSSGGNGIHLYLIWDEPQDAYSVRMAMEDVLLDCLLRPGTKGLEHNQVEIFPKQNAVAADEYGSMFILPLAFESTHIEGKWQLSTPVPKLKAPKPKKTKPGKLPDLEIVIAAVEAIPNDDLDYDTWRNIIFSIHAATGGSDDGFDIARDWSATCPKHDDEFFAERVWPYIKSGKGITPQTLLFHARESGWKEDIRSKFEDLGEDEEKSGSQRPTSGERSAAVRERGVRIPDADTLPAFQRDAKGEILAVAGNLEAAIRHSMIGVQIGYDDFTQGVMLMNGKGTWEGFRETDNVRLRIALEKRGFKPIAKETMRDTLLMVAEDHTFDSAQTWLKSLVWDGTPRVETFLPHYFGCADRKYERAIGRYWWTAQAGRILHPGIQCDMVPVLVGKQGIGKSSALAAMVPAREHLIEVDLMARDADLARTMQAALIGEIAELRGLNTREDEHIKAFVTRTQEKWVPKYQEQARTFNRRLVFVGTTNHEQFLTDNTGNRRWLPVNVSSIDRDGIIDDRDQLWAEGCALFQVGGIEYRDAERLARVQHVNFQIEEPWTKAIVNWLKDTIETADDPHVVRITMTDVLIGAGIVHEISRITLMHQRRAAAVLRNAGWESVRARNSEYTSFRAWRLKNVD